MEAARAGKHGKGFAAVDQVNQGLVQIDGVTQQSSANAEETSAATAGFIGKPYMLGDMAAMVRSVLDSCVP